MFKLGPLIASRKKLLINASLDYILILLLFYFFQFDFSIIKIALTINVFAFCWILVSYIIGRYSDFQDVLISKVQGSFNNIITTFFLTGILFKFFQIINNYLYRG